MSEPNARLAAQRERIATLAPKAAQLARQGVGLRDIAVELGVSKSTVSNWLRGRGTAAAKALGTDQGGDWLAARYRWLYEKALREYRRSVDKEVRTFMKTTATDRHDGCTTKETIRTEVRPGNPAFLARALAVLNSLASLHFREAARKNSKGGEPRMLLYGTSDAGRPLVVVFVVRLTDDMTIARIISARRLS